MEISKIYHGFKLIEESPVHEINSVGQLFRHEKSGAQLLHIACDDDNNVFSIGFRTPPKDSCGVAHILEHSVLCGSRKFPTKEPFVELLKGSLKNFLNAFTFPDKTMYPVASKNEKDFFNLMDVYLDAVFYPNIYKNEEIFMQEGWHYELNSKDEPLTYKGVVYNEMKGAFSSPEGVLFRLIQKTLYPDVTYGVESGGDPECIPDLTYADFLDFHTKFYHPSNAYIFLYGDVDLDKKLKFLNDEYLEAFEKKDVDSEIGFQQPFDKMVEYKEDYAILEDEEDKDKTFFALNFVTGRVDDPELTLGLSILENMLLDSSGSPFKKAILGSGLGKDLFGFYETDLLQPVFSIILKNSNNEKKDKFKKLVFSELKKLADEGIDEKLIEASLNSKEFCLRETENDGYPKGLSYNLTAMSSWLYGADPLMHLRYEEELKSIREKAHKGYFEQLITTYFLENNHCSLISLEPSRGLGARQSSELKDKLESYKSSLSEEQLDTIVEMTERLEERQSAQDSPEALATIPVLDIEDIDTETERLPLVEKQGEFTTLHHPAFTNGIAYVRILFDSGCVPVDQLSTLSLLDALLCDVDTENYTYMEFSNEVNTYLGALHFSGTNYVENGDSSVFYPKFIVSSKALVSQVGKMMELAGEVIYNTQLTDKARIHEIVRRLRSRMEMNIMQSGHSIAYKRIATHMSQAAAYNEYMSGLTFYDYIVDLDDNFTTKSDGLLSDLDSIYSSIFNKEGIIVSITAEEVDCNIVQKHIDAFVTKLPECGGEKINYSFDLEAKNEALLIPGQVQYVCKGSNFKKLGYEYSGKFRVMASIARLDYLWNNVRVKGGAYGAMTSFTRTGNMFFVSYRDPNLTETLDIYDGIGEFFENLDIDERELQKYIIGAISQIDQPMTASSKGGQALSNYISHLSYEEEQKEREDVLSITLEDIKEFSKMLKELMADAIICVVGTDEKIKESAELFDDMRIVIE